MILNKDDARSTVVLCVVRYAASGVGDAMKIYLPITGTVRRGGSRVSWTTDTLSILIVW